MAPDRARPLYEQLLEEARKHYNEQSVQSGQFGADMQVEIVNDGPVTIMLDSPSQDGKGGTPPGSQHTASKMRPALSDADILAWCQLPSVPRHDNATGRPSPEHMAAAKKAKMAQKELIARILKRLAAEGAAEWSAKKIEAALKQAASDGVKTRKHASVSTGSTTRDETIESLRQQLARLQARVELLEK